MGGRHAEVACCILLCNTTGNILAGVPVFSGIVEKECFKKCVI